MAVSLFIHLEKWPIAGKFAISRGAKTTAEVVVAELADGRHRGRGECVPYARSGETVEAVAAAIQAMREPLAGGLGRMGLQERMPAGAARNALDCAFWDFEAKRTGTPVHALAGLPSPRPLVTAYTISLDTPARMAAAAAKAAAYRLLKVKLGAAGDPERIRAVRAAAPDCELIATSLAMAPAHLLARRARLVDLDGPLLLAQDRPHGLMYEGSLVYPPTPELWG